MFKKYHTTKGFTLVELMVAVVIFVLAVGTIMSATINFYKGYRREVAENTLYEEARVLMDRIVYEARTNTIDFDEYFNHLASDDGGMTTPAESGAGVGAAEYGKYYRQYYHRFFFINPPESDTDCDYELNDPNRETCEIERVNEGYFSTGADDDRSASSDDSSKSALGGENEKTELYLIDADGMQKTILKRTDSGARLSILKKDLVDAVNNTSGSAGADGYYDSWQNNTDFGSGFIPISPTSMEITNLKFFISPIEDPQKAFNESDVEVQVHPNVTIILTVQVSDEAASTFLDGIRPSITLQTTVSSRVYDNVFIPFGV